MNPSKCQILQQQFKYLGHVITKEGIRADPKKVAAILKMPIPRNLRQLRSFRCVIDLENLDEIITQSVYIL